MSSEPILKGSVFLVYFPSRYYFILLVFGLLCEGITLLESFLIKAEYIDMKQRGNLLLHFTTVNFIYIYIYKEKLSCQFNPVFIQE